MALSQETLIRSISERYSKGNFQQLRLLSLDRFISQANARGYHLSRQHFDDFAEFLPPISVSDDGMKYYHPYQIWTIAELRKRIELNVHWSQWIARPEEQIRNYLSEHRTRITSRLDEFRQQTIEFYRLLFLLSLIEPLYLPSIRKKMVVAIHLEPDPIAAYWNWRDNATASGNISRSDFDSVQLRNWHQRLSLDARNLDETEDWFLLVRHACYEKRDKLRGGTRLAQDFYEMAEMLRLCLFDATGEELPAEDEYQSGGYWKARIYGVDEITYQERIVLKRILREYDLDAAYHGFWFVEGDTEADFFDEFSNHMGLHLEERGIALMNIGGTGDITSKRRETGKKLRGSRQFVELLRKLKSDEVFAFLTADDDQGVADGIESLRKQNLWSAGFAIWQGDFEEGNFQIEELIALIGPSDEGSLIDISAVEAERAKKDSQGKQKALGAALMDIAVRMPGLEQFHKSGGWGKILAKYAAENPNFPNGGKRPAVTAWETAAQMTYADFRGTVEGFSCDETGRNVPITKP